MLDNGYTWYMRKGREVFPFLFIRKIIFSMLVNKESQSAIINIGIISSADGYKRSFTYKWPKPILDVGFPFLILKITLLWILVTINGAKAFFFVNSTWHKFVTVIICGKDPGRKLDLTGISRSTIS